MLFDVTYVGNVFSGKSNCLEIKINDWKVFTMLETKGIYTLFTMLLLKQPSFPWQPRRLCCHLKEQNLQVRGNLHTMTMCILDSRALLFCACLASPSIPLTRWNVGSGVENGPCSAHTQTNQSLVECVWPLRVRQSSRYSAWDGGGGGEGGAFDARANFE